MNEDGTGQTHLTSSAQPTDQVPRLEPGRLQQRKRQLPKGTLK